MEGGGVRTGGGGRRSGGKRKKADAEAGTLTQPRRFPNPPHFTAARGRNLNSLGLTPMTPSSAGYDGQQDLFSFSRWLIFAFF